MAINYQTVWNSMNEIEQTNTKLCNIREILDASNEAIENHNYKRAEALNYAAYEYLEMIQNELDSKFKTAWNATVKQINYPPSIGNWPVTVEIDPITGDSFVNLPEHFCNSFNLKEGDDLQWQLCHDQDDKWILKKTNNSYSV